MVNYCLYVPSATRAAEMTTDYNCYWATGEAKLANIGGVECDTIAEIQAAWALIGKPNNVAVLIPTKFCTTIKLSVRKSKINNGLPPLTKSEKRAFKPIAVKK